MHGRPPLYGGYGGGGGCSSCGGGGDEFYSAPYAPPMKADPFTDDAPESMPTPAPARTNSTRSSGSSRLVRPTRTAAAERPAIDEEEIVQPVKRMVASKPKQIVGTGVAKVVHEEPVTVKKPVSSLKKLPRDEAPAPPAFFETEEVEVRHSALPKNPLRR